MAVDVAKPQGLSSDHQPETRGAGHEGRSTNATHGAAEGTSVNPCTPGPSSRSTSHSIFAKLCREDTDDIADFEDENLSVATGKRVMFADEVEDGSSRPARRVVHLSLFYPDLFLTALFCQLTSLLLFRPFVTPPRIEARQGTWGKRCGRRPGLVWLPRVSP